MARKWTTVEDWVKDCLLDDSRGAPCTAFVCLHMKAVGSDEVAHRSELQQRLILLKLHDILYRKLKGIHKRSQDIKHLESKLFIVPMNLKHLFTSIVVKEI